MVFHVPTLEVSAEGDDGVVDVRRCRLKGRPRDPWWTGKGPIGP